MSDRSRSAARSLAWLLLLMAASCGRLLDEFWVPDRAHPQQVPQEVERPW